MEMRAWAVNAKDSYESRWYNVRRSHKLKDEEFSLMEFVKLAHVWVRLTLIFYRPVFNDHELTVSFIQLHCAEYCLEWFIRSGKGFMQTSQCQRLFFSG